MRLLPNLRHVLLNAVLICLVSSLFFSAHIRGLFRPCDGSYRMQVMRYNFEWTHPSINAYVSPLQGLGNLAYPINGWLSPAALVNSIFSKYEVSPLLVYIVITLELFFEVYWLACCLKVSLFVRLLGAWLAIFFIMPFVAPTLPGAGGFFNFYPISTIIPDIVESVAMVSLIMALITKLDLKRLRFSVGMALLVSFAILYLIIRIPVLCILGLPLVFLFSGYWLLSQFTGPSSVGRAIVLLAVIYLPLLFPFVFLAGCFVETPAAMFPTDFAPPPRVLGVNISLLFSAYERVGWIGSILYVVGLVGAAWAIVKTSGPTRIIAGFYMAYTLVLLGAGLTLTFVFTKYRVPVALYYEWFSWPLMFIYTAFLFEALGKGAHQCVISQKLGGVWVRGQTWGIATYGRVTSLRTETAFLLRLEHLSFSAGHGQAL
jgi:hypothetical protein